MRTRILFLDDSGKPDTGHSSRAVVMAGFALDSEVYSTLSRRVLGAKKRHYPRRGVPTAWEAKSTDIIKPNPWRRTKNRDFCNEIRRLLDESGATCYSVTLEKAKMHHAMTLATSMPLQLQTLVEHFDVECRTLGQVGMVVADWSAHHYDQHASRCVASFVGSRRLSVHPGVYYASSHGSEAIQVCDLLAGIRRRAAEGDINMFQIDRDLQAVRTPGSLGLSVRGRPFTNCISLF